MSKEECHDFIRRLVAMKGEAGRLGLLRTMRELDGATKVVGFELAGIIEKGGQNER